MGLRTIPIVVIHVASGGTAIVTAIVAAVFVVIVPVVVPSTLGGLPATTARASEVDVTVVGDSPRDLADGDDPLSGGFRSFAL